jgi:hypothetical protein
MLCRYDYPEDPYILRGSCQVIFSLKGNTRSPSSYSSYSSSYGHSSGGGGLSLGKLLIGGVLLYVMYQIFQHFKNQQHHGSSSSTRSSYQPPPPQSTHTSYVPTGGGMGGWGGFFGGMGLGGALGSMFARR